MTEPHLLTLAGAGAVLAVSARTVRRLIDAGDLPPVRIGRSLRVRSIDVRAYIDSRITPSDTGAGVAVPETTPCRDDNQGRRTAFTNARTRPAGGPATRANEGAALAVVLGFPSPTTRKG